MEVKDRDQASTQEQVARLKDQQKKLIEKEEKRLATLRAQYAQEAADLNMTGEAAINHIKAQQAKDIAGLKNRNKEALDSIQEEYNSRIDHIRKNQGLHNENLKTVQKQNQQILQQEYERNKALLEDTRSRNQNLLSQESQKQNERIQKIHKMYSEEVGKAEKVSDHELEEIRIQNRTETQKLSDEGRKSIESLKQQNKKLVETEVKQNTQQIESTRRGTQEQIAESQREMNESMRLMRKKYDESVGKEKVENRQELSELEKNQANILNRRRIDYARATDAQKQEYNKQIAYVHKEGDKHIAEEQNRARGIQSKQTTANKKELEEMNQRHLQKRGAVQVAHEKEIARNEQTFDKNLKRQHQEYGEKINMNQKLFDQAYDNQARNFDRAMKNQRLERMQEFKKYGETEEDPFYSMKNLGSTFRENDNYYVIETEVPKHEYKNVDIRVQKDTVVVSGARSFADKHKDEHGSISTNKQETFREEFPINKAIREKEIEKFYADGKLRVLIPKVT